jgi:nucleotide-binding universal stress UspA family protein
MYKRFLVPLGGSALAEQSMSHAVALAEQFGADIVLLRVLPPPLETTFSPPGAVQTAERRSARLARDYLDGVATQVRERGITAQVALMDGKPHVEIALCRSARNGYDRRVHARAVRMEPLAAGQRGRPGGTRGNRPGVPGAMPRSM